MSTCYKGEHFFFGGKFGICFLNNLSDSSSASLCTLLTSRLWLQKGATRFQQGNLLTPAAALLNGKTFAKFSQFANILKFQFISKYTFHKDYVFPTVHDTWGREQGSLLTELQAGHGINWSGDGRCDSPSFSAKFCTYCHMSTDKIVNEETVQVTEVMSSKAMEKEGCKKDPRPDEGGQSARKGILHRLPPRHTENYNMYPCGLCDYSGAIRHFLEDTNRFILPRSHTRAANMDIVRVTSSRWKSFCAININGWFFCLVLIVHSCSLNHLFVFKYYNNYTRI